MITAKHWIWRIIITFVAAFSLCGGVFAIEDTCNNVDEFYAIFEENLTQQIESFAIKFTGDADDLHPDGRVNSSYFQRQMSARDADDADNVDFVAYNISTARLSQIDNRYIFNVTYLATHEELAVVEDYVETVIEDFSFEGKDDFLKTKYIYEHVSTNFTYDHTLTQFSAYDGVTTGAMVCQGYALLTSALLWEADVPNRIVTGTSRMQNHAWNIVEIDGAWYNLDSTWDAVDEADEFMDWNYFLKNQADFLGHDSFSFYLTDTYLDDHPFAEESYNFPQMKVFVDEDEVYSLIIRTGMPVALDAVFPENTSKESVTWDMNVEDGISVTEDGLLSADKAARDIMQVSATENNDIIPAKLYIQSVDLTTASPWAFDTITEYYLSQILPPDLCNDFQTGITRSEVALLAVELITQTMEIDDLNMTNEYLDIDNHPYFIQILACSSWGIIGGDSSTTFAPDRVLSREEAAAVLVRVVEYITGELPQAPQATFSDRADISPWATESVDKAAYIGLLQGNDGLFKPQDTMTREEFMVAMNRVYLMHMQTALEEVA